MKDNLEEIHLDSKYLIGFLTLASVWGFLVLIWLEWMWKS